MQSLNDIWNLAVEDLSHTYSETEADLWFRGLTLSDLTDSGAVILCDLPFKYKIISNRYLGAISAALEKIIGFPVEVKLLSKEYDPVEFSSYNKPESVPEPVNLAEECEFYPPEESGFTISTRNKEDRDYTFNNFIVGNSNKFAHAASYAVANNPACKDNPDYSYNPLFIYGPSGLGKTHLLYAIIHQIRMTRPSLKIVYVKGEEFTNQLIDSISRKTSDQFREKYRTADILLIDDIQFIAGRDSTQEEFFHTFNALYEDHKQIILTSDRPPRDIKTLEDRLKTRFEWGMTADIQPPDADLRAAIIRRKASSMGISLSNEVMNYLAENLQNNIRQIEGGIKKLGAYSMLTGEVITIDLAKKVISDLIVDSASKKITTERIFETVSKKYGISVEDIKSKKKTKEIASARHVFVYLMRTLTETSLVGVGKILNRDHTTIMASYDNIRKEIGSGSIIDLEIEEIVKELKG